MKYLKTIEEYQGQNRTAITLGKFDGLHRGHQKLINAVAEKVANMQVSTVEVISSVVFAFDMMNLHKELGKSTQQIMLKEERVKHLEGQVDYLIDCQFDNEIRHMSAEEFIRTILVEKFRVKYIVVGEDFHFGYKALGNAAMLEQYAEEYNYSVEIIEQEMYQEQVISSSYIKSCIRNGELTKVNDMLGYEYSIIGEVIHGKKLGRKLGFPTMNIVPSKEKLLPPFGVYTISVKIGDQFCNGIANVGKKPTVEANGLPQVETYVFDYEGDAYGENIEVYFQHFQRSEKKFNSVELLKRQVEEDIQEARNIALL
ncbi:MAG: bifunctional riboflavin kinase/FAD synthetase [Eubacteriales bacterium]